MESEVNNVEERTRLMTLSESRPVPLSDDIQDFRSKDKDVRWHRTGKCEKEYLGKQLGDQGA